MSENQNEIFTKIIKDSELKSLAADYAEIAVDGIIKEGTLKDIPLIGTLISVIKFGNSINKNILTKKIYKFLFELKNIPEEKRRKKFVTTQVV